MYPTLLTFEAQLRKCNNIATLYLNDMKNYRFNFRRSSFESYIDSNCKQIFKKFSIKQWKNSLKLFHIVFK